MSQDRSLDLSAPEAEASVVAALMGDEGRAAFDRLAVKVDVEDFFVAECRLVFAAFGALVAKGVVPDASTLATYIKASTGYTEKVGHVISQASATPYLLENVDAYGIAIHEKAVARKVRTELLSLADKTKLIGGELSSEDVLRQADAISLKFEGRGAEVQLLNPPSAALTAFVERLDAVEKGDVVGVKFGLAELDRRVTFMPADLVIIAGRPSMGKTALALSGPLDEARAPPEKQDDSLVAVFSLEMDTEKLMTRCMSNLGTIDHDHLKRATLNDSEWNSLTLAIQRFDASSIRIDCDPILSISILRSKLRLLKAQTGKKLRSIYIDYLQLMTVDSRDGYHANRAEQIAYISRNLKLIAKEEKATVFALSQLNRAVESRPDKRPGMGDLRESGALEQDADTIIMVYRDEYYNPDSEWKGMAELIVAKARDGGAGTVMVEFRGQYQQFLNADRGRAYESVYKD